jgi:hypothetical protein
MRGAAYRRGGLSAGGRTAEVAADEPGGTARPGGTLTSLESDRREIECDEEVLEEVLDHANLIVQSVIALEQM